MQTKELKDYTRDELLHRIKHHEERELYFARLLGVADAGQFRADWDAPVLKLIQDNKDLKEALANADETSESTRRKIIRSEVLREFLVRAVPFIEGHPLFKEVFKFLKDDPEPAPYKEALEVAMVHLMVWHHRYFEDVDDSEKTDLNWILEVLGKPRRYNGVPTK